MKPLSERQTADRCRRKISKIKTNLDKLDDLLGISSDASPGDLLNLPLNPNGWSSTSDGHIVHQDDMRSHLIDKNAGDYEFEIAQDLLSQGGFKTVLEDRKQIFDLIGEEDWDELGAHFDAFQELIYSIEGISHKKLTNILEEISDSIEFLIDSDKSLSWNPSDPKGIDHDLYFKIEQLKALGFVKMPDPKDLKESRFFEELVSNLFQRMGFETNLTPSSRDGGKDVIATGSPRDIGTRYLIECKRNQIANSVGVKDLRALLGVKHSEGATKGILVTTSSFSPEAITFAKKHPWELELIDHAKLNKLLGENFPMN